MRRPAAVALGMLERNLGCLSGTFCAAPVIDFSSLSLTLHGDTALSLRTDGQTDVKRVLDMTIYG